MRSSASHHSSISHGKRALEVASHNDNLQVSNSKRQISAYKNQNKGFIAAVS